MTFSLAQVGLRGWGQTHLANALRLQRAGLLRLVAVADHPGHLHNPQAGPDLDGVRLYDDLGRLLSREAPDVVVIATPPHLHAGMAQQAFAAGAHVLVEKPPAVLLPDLDAMVAAGVRARRLGQVGFNHLGSAALPRLRRLLAEGELGDVVAIGVAGAWQRDDSYYRRAAWAGRLRLDGDYVLDGTIMNPFAHALIEALVIAGWKEAGGGRPLRVRGELYRAHDIEGDDTSSLRVELDSGVAVVVATTLCAGQPFEPYILVRGTRRSATLYYTTVGERVDLLANLLAVAAGRQERLVCPLADTRDYLGVANRLYASAGRPAPIPAAFVHREGSATVIDGIEPLLRRCAAEGLLLSEAGAPWARLSKAVPVWTAEPFPL